MVIRPRLNEDRKRGRERSVTWTSGHSNTHKDKTEKQRSQLREREIEKATIDRTVTETRQNNNYRASKLEKREKELKHSTSVSFVQKFV